jgi:hypothetical protein
VASRDHIKSELTDFPSRVPSAIRMYSWATLKGCPAIRSSDAGNSVTFQFCPVCGSTVYRKAEGYPSLIAVAVGSFADPAFQRPQHSVWEKRRHYWVQLCDTSIQHSD